MAINKVVYDGSTLIDLSNDTLSSADQLAQGIVAHDRTGATVTGTIVIPSAGTEGTPVATKGTVSNHSISVTPSVTNVGGVIQGGTHTGTAVTVSASELVSGTLSVTSSGTKDVTNYASVSIPAADAAGTADGSFVTQNGQRKWVLTAAIYGETAGWIDEGLSGQNPRTFNAVASGTTVTPTTSSQTIGGANTMMEGAVTINPIPSQYIVPTGNLPITQNGTVDVTNLASVTVNVSGGGSNVVEGTFTASTTKGQAQTVNIPYTGNGYPVQISIEVDGGMYNSNNTAWYSTIQRYAVGLWFATKRLQSNPPDYSSSSADNNCCVLCISKNSTSNPSNFTNSTTQTSAIFSTTAASASNSQCVRFNSKNTMSVFVASTSYGFMSGITYRYRIFYSS